MASPITVNRLIGITAPEVRRLPENNAVTAKVGTPVALAGGYVQKAAVQNSNTSVILGFSAEPGKNRTTAGVAQVLTQGSVLNQANAQIIPPGVAMDDGKMGVYIAGPAVRFRGSLHANNNVAQALVGALAGLTEDTNNFWYVDLAKNNAASGGMVRITDLVDAIGTAGGRVEFEVINSRIQTMV